MKIAAIVNRKGQHVESVRETEPLDSAVDVMHRKAIGSVVVHDSGAREILGIVSQTEIVAATAARDFIDTIINVEADLVARSASMQGGRIILAGGDQSTININAVLDATGTPGGSIAVHIRPPNMRG